MPSWENPSDLIPGLIAAGIVLGLIGVWLYRRRRRNLRGFLGTHGESLKHGHRLRRNMQRMREEAPFRQEDD